MQLSKRITLTIVGIMAAMLAVLVVAGRFLLFGGVVNVEDEQVQRFRERVDNTIEYELSSLRSVASDWAVWDDTYVFIDTLDPLYVERNLGEQSLEAINVNMMAYIDKHNEVAYVHQFQVELPESIIADLLTSDYNSGIINTDGKMVFFAREAISDSLGVSPPRGVLVVARVMSSDIKQRFEGLLQVDISIQELDEETWLTPVIRLDDKWMIARSIVPTATGARGFYIDARLQRTTNMLARRYMWLFVVTAVTTIGLFMLILKQVLHHYVVARLNNLTEHLGQLAATKGIGHQPNLPESDEVLAMTLYVERIFDELSRAQTQLIESEDSFRLLFSSLPVGVALRELILDDKGRPVDYKYLDINPTYAAMSEFKREDVVGKLLSEITGEGLVLDLPEEYITVAMTGKPCRFDRLYGNGKWFDVLVYSPKPLHFASIAIDITERKRSEYELSSSQRDLEHLFNSLQDMVLILDPAGVVLHVNDAVLKRLGYNRDELVGCTSQELHPEFAYEELAENIAEVISGKKPSQSIPLQKKDGTVIPVETMVSLGRWGGQDAIFAVARDVTERQRAEEHLRYVSLHDQLTGLYNRAFFAAELERFSGGRDYPLSIICADANGLKLINDTLGHLAGDELLKESAVILKSCLRKSDILARVGGDEFAAILPNTDQTSAEAIVARIKSAAANHNILEFNLPMSFSIGCATSSFAQQELEEIFLIADNMMYRDKLSQRTQIRLQIFSALQRVLQGKDYFGLDHNENLKKVLSDFAQYLGVSQKTVADLHALAEVHDLGLIAIPDEVLHKPGRLTAEEREAILQHPEKGYRIAYSSPELMSIAEFILHHHEHWDGQGYPLHLAEEQIPLESRVFAIVDAFDVMTSGRPYSKAKSAAEALAEIRAHAGTQFDPHLAEQFYAMMTEREV